MTPDSFEFILFSVYFCFVFLEIYSINQTPYVYQVLWHVGPILLVDLLHHNEPNSLTMP